MELLFYLSEKEQLTGCPPAVYLFLGPSGAFPLVDEKKRLVVFLISLIHTNKIVTTDAPNIAQICRPVFKKPA
jgi:hypothetical protein